MRRKELELKAKEFDSKLTKHPMSSEELQKVLCDFVESFNERLIGGSLHCQISDVIMENGLLIKKENWDEKQMEIRAIYDSYRIINLFCSNFLSEQ